MSNTQDFQDKQKAMIKENYVRGDFGQITCDVCDEWPRDFERHFDNIVCVDCLEEIFPDE